VFDLKQIVGSALNMAGDLVPMSPPQQERAQNNHVQRALEEIETM
jgi:hypothetical protein